MDVYRGSVLWWEINEAVRNLQDPQLARERLSCWSHMFLAYSSTEEPGGLIYSFAYCSFNKMFSALFIFNLNTGIIPQNLFVCLQIIEVKFEKFDVERDNYCRYDYVAIFNGGEINDAKRIGKYCGDSPPAYVSYHSY